MKMPIPNDWDGQTFCNYVVKWPNSTLWRIVLRGVCTNPALVAFWDASTGDVDQTIESFQEALDYLLNELRCTVEVPVGVYYPYAGLITSQDYPDKHLPCDGRAVSRTEYADLFAAIGTIYGVGNGLTTFNIPNIKGRVPVGQDVTQGEFLDLGQVGGAKTHTLNSAQIPAHLHSAFNYVGAGGTHNWNISGGGNNQASLSTGLTGSNQAHNNLQPYIVTNYIIRAEK